MARTESGSGIHVWLSGADAIIAATNLKIVADISLRLGCDCRSLDFRHKKGCRGLALSEEPSRIALNIETQIMRKARWRARKDK